MSFDKDNQIDTKADRLLRIQLEIDDRQNDYAQNRHIGLTDAQWLVDEIIRLRVELLMM